MKKKLPAVLATVVFILGMCGVANALTITNGGFETGGIDHGWMVDPDYFAYSVGTREGFNTTHDNAVYPTQGSYFASLEVEGFRGYDTALSQYISWEPGDTLSFDWNFYTYAWLNQNDAAVFQISENASITSYHERIILTDVMTLRPPDPDLNGWPLYYIPGCGGFPNAGFDFQNGNCTEILYNNPVSTGWQTYTYHFQSEGAGYINFGITNLWPSAIDFESYLLIDNVRATVIPEPSTVLLFGTGLLVYRFIKIFTLKPCCFLRICSTDAQQVMR